MFEQFLLDDTIDAKDLYCTPYLYDWSSHQIIFSHLFVHTGKTSILDVLSGRSAYDTGVITLDGEIVTDRVMKKMKKKVAYVKQSDLFFGHLTVRDQLTYTAFLRLPSSWPKIKKVGEVNRIIQQLRLNKCADTPIFMISGGEKKRVNIGSELLTDPAIILLGELFYF